MTPGQELGCGAGQGGHPVGIQMTPKALLLWSSCVWGGTEWSCLIALLTREVSRVPTPRDFSEP